MFQYSDGGFAFGPCIVISQSCQCKMGNAVSCYSWLSISTLVSGKALEK